MAVIFNVAGTLPKIRKKKKIGSTKKKKKLVLYRRSALDSKGKKVYSTSKNVLEGDLYYYDNKNQLHSLHIDEKGNDYGISVRNSRVM